MSAMRAGFSSGHAVSSASPVCQKVSPVAASTPLIFIVDPDPAMHDSLGQLIRRQGWQAQIFPSAEEFLARPFRHAPSCLMLEVSLPGLSGLELQRRFSSQRPGVPILFLSAKRDVATTVRAMKAGAAEFFTKPFREEELLGALREALEQSRLALAEEAEDRALQNCFASLTPRERQVMALVSSGWLNKQVGGELGISEVTVKAHRGQVMRKMRASSFADLVTMAGRLELAADPESPGFLDHDHLPGFRGRQFGAFLKNSVMSLVPMGAGAGSLNKRLNLNFSQP